jgi:hypothetical protein
MLPSSPAAFLIERIIVSFGMLFAFAFATMSLSLELAAMSGPPSLTATASSLPIFVNEAPRFASVFSFLRFMFAHFECPDIIHLTVI